MTVLTFLFVCLFFAIEHISLCSQQDLFTSDEEEVGSGPNMKYTRDDRRPQEESGPTFTVEEAVEAMGFGRFQLTIYFVAGVINVSLLH